MGRILDLADYRFKNKSMDFPFDLDITFTDGWLDAQDAATLYERLLHEVLWQQQPITIYGRTVMQPRLLTWMGDADAVYTYSNIRQVPMPWSPSVLSIRQQVEAAAGARFNSVLLNYYRNGADSMGWHSDDEVELGDRPIIASLSLGAARRFIFRPVDKNDRRRVPLVLSNGSLLVMCGDCQRRWHHAVPKTARPVGGRINLTFRWIKT